PVEPVEPAALFVPPVADAPAVDAVSADAPLPSGELTAEQMAALMSGGLDPTPGDAMAIPAAQWGSFPLSLEASRVEQLQFMVAAAKVHLENLNVGLAQAAEFSTRADGCQTLRELANAVDVIAEAFNFDCLGTLSRLYREALNALPTVNDEVLPELLVRVVAIAGLFEQYLLGLEVGMEMRWQTELISRRVGRLCSGRTLAENITGWHKGEVARLLELDGVNEPISPVPVEGGPSVEIAPGWFCHPVLAKWFDPEAAAAAAAAAAANTAAQKQAEGNTSLVRVPAVVLDKLLDTVSQLVLSKNRVVSLSRALHTEEGRQHRMEELATTADDLTQLCSDLQLIMMQARMQPVGKLFERYPRVIRDVASVADKTVELKLEGGATLVDKHVFEGLGEPLANLLRAVVQGSIEKSDARTALGKPATAVLVLRAENQGSQVFITLSHDGTPPDRVAILQKAVESGMLTEAEMDSIAENDIPSLLFRDGSGDAALAKVGAQVRSIGGTIGFRPEKDGITQLLITVPLSVAIIPAVMVQVSSEIYAVPLQSVAEIVRLADHPVQTIRSHWVMRLRERVVPMVDIARTIGLAPSLCAAGTPGTETAAASPTSKPQTLVGDRFAIVVNAGDHHAALVVDRVVGKQDVVIKQLEGHTGDAGKGTGDAGFFSGATIRDDGRVSLIFETQRLIAAAQNDASEKLASISKGELESTPVTTDVTSAA
ncbi:MAG: chemotaxis protein CheA, partial [Planctomyces sp.]